MTQIEQNSSVEFIFLKKPYFSKKMTLFKIYFWESKNIKMVNGKIQMVHLRLFSQDKDLICVWKIVKNIQIVLGQPIMKGSNWLYSTWKLYLNTKRYKPETIRQQAMSSAFRQIVALLCWPKVKVGRSKKVRMIRKS